MATKLGGYDEEEDIEWKKVRIIAMISLVYLSRHVSVTIDLVELELNFLCIYLLALLL